MSDQPRNARYWRISRGKQRFHPHERGFVNGAYEAFLPKGFGIRKAPDRIMKLVRKSIPDEFTLVGCSLNVRDGFLSFNATLKESQFSTS